MHPPQRLGDAGIGQPAQQAGRRIAALAGPQGFDQQHLDEAGQHEVAAVARAARLLAEQPHQGRQPLVAVNVDHRRQQRHQQRGVRGLEREIAAAQPDIGGTVGTAMADFIGGFPRRRFGIDPLRRRRCEAGHDESRCRRQQHEIAGLQNDRRRALDGQPAGAFDDGTEAGLAERRILHGPGASPADAFGEDRAGPQQADDLSERIGHDRTI